MEMPVAPVKVTPSEPEIDATPVSNHSKPSVLTRQELAPIPAEEVGTAFNPDEEYSPDDFNAFFPVIDDITLDAILAMPLTPAGTASPSTPAVLTFDFSFSETKTPVCHTDALEMGGLTSWRGGRAIGYHPVGRPAATTYQTVGSAAPEPAAFNSGAHALSSGTPRGDASMTIQRLIPAESPIGATAMV